MVASIVKAFKRAFHDVTQHIIKHYKLDTNPSDSTKIADYYYQIIHKITLNTN